jgi:hypothetical protein
LLEEAREIVPPSGILPLPVEIANKQVATKAIETMEEDLRKN